MVLTLVIVIVLLVVAAAVLDAVFMQTVRTVRAMDLDSRPRGAAEESIDAGS
ncbi:MAG: hypothetical protein H6811_08725 [Phycisphaeraceae bacterium]|nr:hypothetical protein [Phycisphaeraceae bacterium]